MKLRHVSLPAVIVSLLLAGCATTDSELSQKEKDKMAREMERANQKQAQAQEKTMKEVMKDATRTNQPRGYR